MTHEAWGFAASLILLSSLVVVLGPLEFGWTIGLVPLGLFAAWRALR